MFNPRIDWANHVLNFEVATTTTRTATTSQVDIDYGSQDMIDAREQVPREYHEYLDVFSKAKGESLPEHHPYDLKIDLTPGMTPPFGGVYRLAQPEQEFLKAYIDDMLEKGLIRVSSSRAASPVLFAPKKPNEDGTPDLRVCVDYRKLNAMTTKDRYPLPSTDMLLDRLQGAVIFTKIDLRWAYHRIRIAAGDE
ncbi:hypothetical protein RQP46_005763 [Phenoliferia psychrophenolica]